MEGTFFLPYQKAWIEDTSRLKLMEKSRQIGMSWAAAYAAVRGQIFKKFPTRSVCWVASRDEQQARLFLEDCLRFAEFLKKALKRIGQSLLDYQVQAQSLVFGKTGAIYSLSSSPNAQAGKRGSRILDEFALHPEPKKLYSIAYPGITWGGSLELISTHRGASNFFNTLVQEIRERGNPKNFSHHRVTLSDALDQGFLKKLQSKLPPEDPRQAMDNDAYFYWIRQGCPDEETFLQEYQCQPLDENSGFLEYALIRGCEYPDATPWELESLDAAQGPLFLGIDIARDQDLSVFWMLELLGDVFFTRKVITLKKHTFLEQEDILCSLLKETPVRRVCIDQTGLGRQFAEQAQQRFGASRVLGLHFTQALKEQMAYGLKNALEQKRLRLPGTAAIRNDLRSVQRSFSSHGALRFEAKRGAAGHGDHFWALALALHAAQVQNNVQKIHYESLSAPWRRRS